MNPACLRPITTASLLAILLSAFNAWGQNNADSQAPTKEAEIKEGPGSTVAENTDPQTKTNTTTTATETAVEAQEVEDKPTTTVDTETPAPKELTFAEKIDAKFGGIVGVMAKFLFWEPVSFDKITENKVVEIGLPLIVLLLLFGGIFFTIYHRFLNIRAFKHAIDVTRGKYDDPNAPGEISHFQALTSALSATVGLGNIAGVAVAISAGGPGAVFWMIIIGLFGMSAKFHECTLAQMYRQTDPDGTIHGGPMYYLDLGLRERGIPPFIAKAFGVIFAIFCIGGSFGGGNMFQANQAREISEKTFGMSSESFPWIFGLVLAFLVGLVIIGGIKRIGQVTEKIIPFMCGIYLLAGLVILITNASNIPAAISTILSSAFSFEAGVGGFIGVAVQGIKRAVFSNEAGIGSAAIAHSAAKTDEPVREGVVALLEPFIDTVVICSMTALVVIVSGAYENPEAGNGVAMTSWAFSQTISWFPYLLAISVFLFAYSTMISWSYYGEKCWAYLFGHSRGVVMVYRVMFLCFVVLGAIASLGNVIDFSDLMILSMAFPNIVGGLILAPKVKANLNDYWSRYEAGNFKIFK
ncbi:MAG: alanine/glycine:cation symporter family protein [Myxococcota bacterium]|nr:alanine/glycine:cation symporter family protein [Myxococcota bacterium]